MISCYLKEEERGLNTIKENNSFSRDSFQDYSVGGNIPSVLKVEAEGHDGYTIEI